MYVIYVVHQAWVDTTRARQLYQQAVRVFRKAAHTCSKQGRNTRALAIYERALALGREQLGEIQGVTEAEQRMLERGVGVEDAERLLTMLKSARDEARVRAIVGLETLAGMGQAGQSAIVAAGGMAVLVATLDQYAGDHTATLKTGAAHTLALLAQQQGHLEALEAAAGSEALVRVLEEPLEAAHGAAARALASIASHEHAQRQAICDMGGASALVATLHYGDRDAERCMRAAEACVLPHQQTCAVYMKRSPMMRVTVIRR